VGRSRAYIYVFIVNEGANVSVKWFCDWEDDPAVILDDGMAFAMFDNKSWASVDRTEVREKATAVSEARFRKLFPYADLSTIPPSTSASLPKISKSD